MSTRTRLYSSLLLALSCAVGSAGCSTVHALRGWAWHRVPINNGPVAVNEGQPAPETHSASGLIVRDYAEADALASKTPVNAAQEPVETAEPQGASPLPLAPSQVPVSGPSTSFQGRTVGFTFLFPVGGSKLVIPDKERADLIVAAKAAGHVTVIGRTDGNSYSPGDEQVALRRALAGRAELIKAGIDPTRIAIEFASSADYAAANDTPEGRQANRRVEFFFITPERYAALH